MNETTSCLVIDMDDDLSDEEFVILTDILIK